MKTFIAVYFGSSLLAIIATPLVIYFAHRLKTYDSIDMRKVHTGDVPRIGGIAIFLSAVSFVIATLFLDNRIGLAFRHVRPQIVTMLVSALFIFLVGLVDDFYSVRARYKLLAQIIAASVICCAGIRISSMNFANLFTVKLGLWAFPVTIFWIVAITNAVNLIDGLDGLAAGIAAITCAVIAVFAIDNNLPVMAVLMLAMLGSLTGFLLFNFNPAKIFMGDSGSLFLGFIIASASVQCTIKSGTIIGLALPFLALGLPIFDTFFTILRRYLGRRRIMSPDRNHLHHKLIDMGLRHKDAVIVMYLMTAAAAGLGLFMMLTKGAGAVTIFLCILILLLLTFRAVGAIRMRETLEGLKRKRAIARQIDRELDEFHNTELCFSQAKTFDQWWNAACFAADKMDFYNSVMPIISRSGTSQVLRWQKTVQNFRDDEVVKMSIPLRDRRQGPTLILQVEICTNGSVESAVRRASLFSRLIEEHSLANLPRNSSVKFYHPRLKKREAPVEV